MANLEAPQESVIPSSEIDVGVGNKGRGEGVGGEGIRIA